MLVRYWMTPKPQTVLADEPISIALTLFQQYKIRRLPVVASDGKLTGILSQSNLCRFASPASIQDPTNAIIIHEDWATRPVSDVMTARPFTCAPNDPIEIVATRMKQQKIGALPVVRSDRPIGIITETDLFGAFAEITHADAGGTRICFQIPRDHAPKIHRNLYHLCEKHDAHLSMLLTHHDRDDDVDIVTLRVEGKGVDELVEAIWELEYRVLQVV